MTIHCCTVPAELLKNKLFGHLKGSFTGATADRPGLIEAMHVGTLFLDKIGEVPAAMQVKRLRFLNDGSYQPVGARVPREDNVRIVAATHRNLAAAVAEGSFREDLFYRLKGVVLRTPSLAERATDVPLLARLFLRRAAEGRANFSPDALNWLPGRGWPGNIRELRAAVECAAALAIPGAAGTIAPPKVSKRKWGRWNIAASSRRSSAPGITTPIRRANWACRASACSRRWIGWGCTEFRPVTAPFSLAPYGPPTDASGADSADASEGG